MPDEEVGQEHPQARVEREAAAEQAAEAAGTPPKALFGALINKQDDEILPFLERLTKLVDTQGEYDQDDVAGMEWDDARDLLVIATVLAKFVMRYRQTNPHVNRAGQLAVQPGKDRMSIVEFRELGYLQEVNRRLLHPMGLALEASLVDGTEVIFSVWDCRTDPIGIVFGPDTATRERADRFDQEWDEREAARREKLGYMTQPLYADPDTNPEER